MAGKRRTGGAPGTRSPADKNRQVASPPSVFEEGPTDWDPGLPERLDVQVGPGGRIVIPAVFRAAMQVKEGDRLMARVVDGELRLITPKMAIAWAQKMVRETIPEGVSLVDDLLEERRREFEDEMKDG